MGFDTSGAKGRNKDVRKCGLLVSPDFLKRFLPSASPRHSDNHLFSSSTLLLKTSTSSPATPWFSQIILCLSCKSNPAFYSWFPQTIPAFRLSTDICSHHQHHKFSIQNHSFLLFICLATLLISWSSQPLLSSTLWSFPNQPLFYL